MTNNFKAILFPSYLLYSELSSIDEHAYALYGKRKIWNRKHQFW